MKNNMMRIALVLCLCAVVFAVWDKDKPSSSTSLRNSNPEMLANQSALETSFGNEHEFSTGGTNSGDHTQGSARSFSQATAPATQIDGGAFASTDLGSLWVDTDDNAFYMLTATTPTWTPVSTEVIATMLGSARVFSSILGVTGNFAVNTNMFTVAAATGNTAVAGTFGVTGVATLGDTSALATSGAPAADAQIANKKYVDDQITANADPTYSGGESHTFNGGLIIKIGSGSFASGASVTFGTAFPNAIISAQVTGVHPGSGVFNFTSAPTTSAIVLNHDVGGSVTIHWFAIGY